jgi:hypothetical protein
MAQHLGKPIPSPALMEHIGTRFRRAVESYASSNGIPWVRFGKDDRKIDVMQPTKPSKFGWIPELLRCAVRSLAAVASARG